ncbi:MAG TPA: NADH-quinone oxidoreductase subunit NuoK [Capsulimonadaceae bacterium]|jgi:NADH-quinone oxidoreductase subunit K
MGNVAVHTPLEFYLILSAILFTIGTVGVLTKRNPIIMFMSVELMLNAVNLSLVAFSRYLNDIGGQLMVIFVMAVAAAEVAVGLGIIVTIYRNRDSINIDRMDTMSG